MRGTQKTSLTALFIGLGTTLLYLSALTGPLQLTLMVFSSVFTAAAVVECGMTHGVLCWIGTSLLGLFIAPDKGAALCYAAFLGWYPLAKSLTERIGKRFFEYIIKFILASIIIVLYIFVLQRILATDIDESIVELSIPAAFLFFYLAFALYDTFLTLAIKAYLKRISKYKNRR